MSMSRIKAGLQIFNDMYIKDLTQTNTHKLL